MNSFIFLLLLQCLLRCPVRSDMTVRHTALLQIRDVNISFRFKKRVFTSPLFIGHLFLYVVSVSCAKLPIRWDRWSAPETETLKWKLKYNKKIVAISPSRSVFATNVYFSKLYSRLPIPSVTKSHTASFLLSKSWSKIRCPSQYVSILSTCDAHAVQIGHLGVHTSHVLHNVIPLTDKHQANWIISEPRARLIYSDWIQLRLQ